MTKKFICEVRKDSQNNELELVHTKHYNTVSSPENNVIKFSNSDEMEKYFNKHCISEDQLQNSGNNLFMFLFYILLLVFIVTMICQLTSGKPSPKLSPTSAFGKFSF